MRRECYVCGTITEGINHPICIGCKKEQNTDSVAMSLDVYESYGNDNGQPKQKILIVQGL